MAEYEISWTETRTLSYGIILPLDDVIAVFREHAPDVLTDAITDAIDSAYADVDRMGPVLEELRKRANAEPDDDALDDINESSASLSE
jgi:hypothetical protein